MGDEQQITQPGRKWTRYLLVASLGLNIIVAGLVGGAMLRGGPPDHIRRDRDVSVLGLRAYYRALDESSQTELRDAIKAKRTQIKVGRAAFRAHLEALANAISVEPFDPAAVTQVLQSQAGTVSENIRTGHQLLLDRVSAMSPEARQTMAERLLQPPKRRGPGRN